MTDGPSAALAGKGRAPGEAQLCSCVRQRDEAGNPQAQDGRVQPSAPAGWGWGVLAGRPPRGAWQRTLRPRARPEQSPPNDEETGEASRRLVRAGAGSAGGPPLCAQWPSTGRGQEVPARGLGGGTGSKALTRPGEQTARATGGPTEKAAHGPAAARPGRSPRPVALCPRGHALPCRAPREGTGDPAAHSDGQCTGPVRHRQ